MGLLLLLGFGGSSALSFFTLRGSLNRQLASSTLLTAKAITSDLERSLTRPVLVSSSMARNTFLQKWVADGERDPAEMAEYLRDVLSQYGATTAFFVSERSGSYTTPMGCSRPSPPATRATAGTTGCATWPFPLK